MQKSNESKPDSFSVGDTVYFLYDYDWLNGTILHLGKTKMKIRTNLMFTNNPYDLRVLYEKVASPDDRVAIVWETWKGRNGRGGYRVERELYQDKRILAKDISRSGSFFGNEKGRVTE